MKPKLLQNPSEPAQIKYVFGFAGTLLSLPNRFGKRQNIDSSEHFRKSLSPNTLVK
jgi:hypothetical protein